MCIKNLYFKFKHNIMNRSQLLLLYRSLENKKEKRILDFLKTQEAPLTVKQIWVFLKTKEESEISQGLKNLRKVGVVFGKKDGKEIYYAFDEQGYHNYISVIEFLEDHIKYIGTRNLEKGYFIGNKKRVYS